MSTNSGAAQSAAYVSIIRNRDSVALPLRRLIRAARRAQRQSRALARREPVEEREQPVLGGVWWRGVLGGLAVAQDAQGGPVADLERHARDPLAIGRGELQIQAGLGGAHRHERALGFDGVMPERAARAPRLLNQRRSVRRSGGPTGSRLRTSVT
jgi:hypothetical protein